MKIGYVVTGIGGRTYWNHASRNWVKTVDDATLYGTYDAALKQSNRFYKGRHSVRHVEQVNCPCPGGR